MTHRIRPAQESDLDALCALETASFPSDRLSRRQMRYHLKNKNADFVVCADGKTDVVLGYALAFYHAGRPARLYSVAVAKPARGQGIGRDLVNTLIEKAKAKKHRRMTLEVRAADRKTVALYERLGFKVTRSIRGYYGDGADALKMVY